MRPRGSSQNQRQGVMSEHDLVTPERERRGRGTTSGDRLMVPLAVVTLLGGLAIVVGNVLAPHSDEVVHASPTPGRSAPVEATPTSFATPTLPGFLLVEPAEPPTLGEPRAQLPQMYVRALERLPIHGGELAGPEVGSVEPGQVILAEDFGEPGWLRVVDPRPLGFISIRVGIRALAEVHAIGEAPSTSISMLAAGDDGYVGAVRTAQGVAELVSSDDGQRWTRSKSPFAEQVASSGVGPVWGPAGWLAFQEDEDALWLWTSPDGGAWESPGVLMGIGAQRLEASIGSADAYLLVLRAGAVTSWWVSSNALAWSQIEVPGIEPGAWLTFASGSQGVYLWDSRPLDCQLPTCAPQREVGAGPQPGFFHSWGGTGWQALPDGPGGIAARVAFLDDTVVGMDQDPATGTIRVWSGSVRGATLAWNAPSEPDVLAGSVLAVLSSDGTNAVTITWDRATEEVRTWRTVDGLQWDAVPAPPGGFSTIPHEGLGSRAGILVGNVPISDVGQGARPQAWVQSHYGPELWWQSRDAPELWWLADDQWTAVTSSALVPVEPPPDPCPAVPADGLDFVLLDPRDGVRCFGNTEITFRAYSVLCNACYRYLPELGWEPEWLAPQSHGLFLAPYATTFAPGRATALDPSLAESPAWAETWVEVTGHFDDPAAAGCRQILDETSAASYPGPSLIVDVCRRRFVLTKVVVIGS